MLSDEKRETLYEFLSICIMAASLFFAMTVFKASYLRVVEALEDLWNSLQILAYKWFLKREPDVSPSVVSYSQHLNSIEWNPILPEEWESFKLKSSSYFKLLIHKSNIQAWWWNFLAGFNNFLKVVLVGASCMIPLVVFIRWLYGRNNKKHNKDTIPLKIFKQFEKITYVPIKKFIVGYKSYIYSNEFFKNFMKYIWILNLNVVSIVAAFFAYWLYFITSWNVSTVYVQIYKLVIDLQVIFKHIPWLFILMYIYKAFNKWRKGVARDRLMHKEARNCGFINELPIVTLVCGTMGKKKTTLITDMALSNEKMQRQMAFKILRENDMKFPNFPWICFEKEIKKCMEYGTIKDTWSIEDWMDLKRYRFSKTGDLKRFYGYDIDRYGFEYDDGLQVYDLFDIMENYAKAYFVYIIRGSLIISNYSTRSDGRFIDQGNFEMYVNDFFPEATETGGRYARIVDYDAVRLGLKIIENNENFGALTFGTFVFSEIGKERQNSKELQETKKKTVEANQKNDLFNVWLKICRHLATICNKPFIKVFADEQRPESWGADARDLADVINIVSSGKERIALPFYAIQEMITELLFIVFMNIYDDMRVRRGDNTLFVYLFKNIVAKLLDHNIRVHSKYGFCEMGVEVERGTLDGKADLKKYFLMNNKIYRKRFTTDCFGDYAKDISRKTPRGLADFREYADVRATIEELRMQNSYFINSLYGTGVNEENKTA